MMYKDIVDNTASKDCADNHHSVSLLPRPRRPHRRRRSSIEHVPSLPNNQPRHSARQNAVSEDTQEALQITCMNSHCSSKATLAEAAENYKTCHNCDYRYCSRECRRAHWEQHRLECVHSRASRICKRVLSTAKDDRESLQQLSEMSHYGYLSRGRGAVKMFFSSTDSAEKYIKHGDQFIGHSYYVPWTELKPSAMGVELYSEVLKLCKTYNPDSKLILLVEMCVLSAVPTGATSTEQWERQLVSRCAKLRLTPSVATDIKRANESDPVRSGKRRSKEDILHSDTVLLKWREHLPVPFRKYCVCNVERYLERRGVNLKEQYSEVYNNLCSYAEGRSERFSAVAVHPADRSGRQFTCIIATHDGQTLADIVTALDMEREREDALMLSTPL